MEPSSSEEDRRDAQLEAIFRTHGTDLYRYIYRQIHNAVIAEDLTSVVFLKALRWLQQDRTPESVKGWLYASTIADYWHEHTQIHLLPLEAVAEMPMLSDESDERMQPLQARIQHLLDRLPSREVVPDTEEGPITVPTDLQEALQQHPAAQTVFERLSYSKKKRFVSWIEHADGEAARSLQVKKIIDLLHEIHERYHQQ